MATVPVHRATLDDESRKLREALRPCEFPAHDADASADRWVAPANEARRTRRLRAEVERIDAGAAAILFIGLALIVCAALLFDY
jgi:hypothetical protein